MSCALFVTSLVAILWADSEAFLGLSFNMYGDAQKTLVKYNISCSVIDLATSCTMSGLFLYNAVKGCSVSCNHGRNFLTCINGTYLTEDCLRSIDNGIPLLPEAILGETPVCNDTKRVFDTCEFERILAVPGWTSWTDYGGCVDRTQNRTRRCIDAKTGRDFSDVRCGDGNGTTWRQDTCRLKPLITDNMVRSYGTVMTSLHHLWRCLIIAILLQLLQL